VKLGLPNQLADVSAKAADSMTFLFAIAIIVQYLLNLGFRKDKANVRYVVRSLIGLVNDLKKPHDRMRILIFLAKSLECGSLKNEAAR